MSPPARLMIPLVATGALLFSACGDKDGDSAATACTAPVAAAGVDLSGTVGAAVTLDGSGSQVCATSVENGQASWSWSFAQVPVGSRLGDGAFSVQTGADAVTTSFTPDVAGDYVIELSVTDEAGTSTDVVVVGVASSDAAPIAACGDDQVARVGERVNMDGSSSADPEGASLAYAWTLAVAPDCSDLRPTDVYNGDQPVASIVPDCDGLYLVSLVVSDGAQWSAPDYCTVDVASGNRLPEADAGESLELPYCAPNPLQLNGWGSYDLDGDELQYLWTVASVPGLSTVGDEDLSDPTVADPTIPWDVPGVYSFELQVFDGTDWSAPDLVTYSIAGLSTNTPPVANAGSDQTIEALGSCSSASYVWSCGDCPEATATLDGSASYDPDGDPIVFQWTESTGFATFSNDRAAVTDIVIPPQPSEYGVETRVELQAAVNVMDCMETDTDLVDVTYTCTGAYLGE